ncbi:YybH family protein [Chroococcidiopsis sp.]|uniref:YybH family protein n=1 Tax=Chroococcidiopsis sp. TaxID=3088168 RepID=UPI003F29FF95
MSQNNLNDEIEIKNLTQKWFDIWSQKEKPFTGKGLEEVFASKAGEMLVYDDFDGDVKIIRSVREYIDTWIPVMQEQFSYHEIQPEGEIDLKIDDSMALSTFIWVSKSKLKNGTDISIRQYATHVWKKIDGRWCLIHEHLTLGKS